MPAPLALSCPLIVNVLPTNSVEGAVALSVVGSLPVMMTFTPLLVAFVRVLLPEYTAR